ncbi:RNA polymerase subunit sigma-70 [Microvirga aerilata]|uniref:RNA polymerase subunit sigma-70 n=1 Tax=Microvirga aerilata TaxID=670292 RepID=A0A937D0X5_9HYPH|nr:RNA polymerase subunit sigma-70 [Microvirga aerilata]MBL0408164.1 RNA polymerase subunit sigma-70 [Microvirga aerilata]
MTTLKQFEEALWVQGMHMALAILETLRSEDKKTRTIAPARRVSGCKMTPELARKILELHGTTDMTQQEIAFQLGVNQGRVNEVIKRRKWLTEDPRALEAVARDKAKARMERGKADRPPREKEQAAVVGAEKAPRRANTKPRNPAQLSIDDFLKGL